MPPNPDIVVTSDTSDIGWGGLVQEKETGGQWLDNEKRLHVNEKELTAVLFSLQSLCKAKSNKTIKILSDNTTAVSYINNMRGGEKECNAITRKIWLWAKERNVWLVATHLPGASNVKADRFSRTLHSYVEWSLSDEIFSKI